MRANLAAFAAGLLFATGLAVGGMTQPSKIIGFLDVTGSWDPSLAFVMAGALGVHVVLFRAIVKRQAPLFAPEFQVPAARHPDARLVAGAALFGVGWGLGGYCPGPGVVSLGTGAISSVVFGGAMLVGIAGFRLVRRDAPASLST